MNSQPPPALQLTLCFREKEEALQLVSRTLAYKKYQLSVTMSTCIYALTTISHRESQRHSCNREDSALACRMDASALSVDPPPLPPRPHDLPPAQRLPRMVSNGE